MRKGREEREEEERNRSLMEGLTQGEQESEEGRAGEREEERGRREGGDLQSHFHMLESLAL